MNCPRRPEVASTISPDSRKKPQCASTQRALASSSFANLFAWTPQLLALRNNSCCCTLPKGYHLCPLQELNSNCMNAEISVVPMCLA